MGIESLVRKKESDVRFAKKCVSLIRRDFPTFDDVDICIDDHFGVFFVHSNKGLQICLDVSDYRRSTQRAYYAAIEEYIYDAGLVVSNKAVILFNLLHELGHCADVMVASDVDNYYSKQKNGMKEYEEKLQDFGVSAASYRATQWYREIPTEKSADDFALNLIKGYAEELGLEFHKDLQKVSHEYPLHGRIGGEKMQILKGFSKGGSSYSSKSLNLHSQEIDRRKKGNEHYRASRPRSGQIVGDFIVWEDGSKEHL